MEEYIRPGKTIGIIGGGAFAFLLALESKVLGFSVYILEKTKDCPAGKMADYFIEGDTRNQTDIENLARLSDVLVYATKRLNLHTLMSISEKYNLPQGVNGIAYAQDLFLKKSFLEENDITIAPYATIVRITDIEENIDGIGYPCRLRESTGQQEVIIEDPSDVLSAMELVKHHACLLESMIAYQYDISLSIARNAKGETLLFPPVDHASSYGEERKFKVNTDLAADTVAELERLAKVIVDAMDYQGVLTVRYHITAEGVIYVDDLTAYPDETSLYSLDACEFSTFSAHLRAICQWPLAERVRCFSPAVTTLLTGKDLSAAKRQVEHQAQWHFYFYDYPSALGNSVVGHVTALTDEGSQTLEEMDTYFI